MRDGLIIRGLRFLSGEYFARHAGQRARGQGILHRPVRGRRPCKFIDPTASDLQLQRTLDGTQLGNLCARDERRGAALRTGAPGAAYAVDEIFRHLRQVVVDDMRHVVHVDAARGDIGGDQHLVASFVEAGQGFDALRLRTSVRAVIVVPTRELAMQVRAQYDDFRYGKLPCTALVIGGMRPHLEALGKGAGGHVVGSQLLHEGKQER